MCQVVLSPNLTKKFQWEVSQIAHNRFPCVTLLGGLSVNLNHLKTKVMQELRDSNNQRNFDYMFANIKVYNGENPEEFDEWAERLETACMISGRDIREAAITLPSEYEQN